MTWPRAFGPLPGSSSSSSRPSRSGSAHAGPHPAEPIYRLFPFLKRTAPAYAGFTARWQLCHDWNQLAWGECSEKDKSNISESLDNEKRGAYITSHRSTQTAKHPRASDTALKLNEAAGGVSSTGVKQGVQAMGSIHREWLTGSCSRHGWVNAVHRGR